MEEEQMHIVEFGLCNSCRYKDTPENESPCWECLNEPVAYASRQPVKYEEA